MIALLFLYLATGLYINCGILIEEQKKGSWDKILKKSSELNPFLMALVLFLIFNAAIISFPLVVLVRTCNQAITYLTNK